MRSQVSHACDVIYHIYDEGLRASDRTAYTLQLDFFFRINYSYGYTDGIGVDCEQYAMLGV